jgi:hypothetical protein
MEERLDATLGGQGKSHRGKRWRLLLIVMSGVQRVAIVKVKRMLEKLTESI